ncbi:MAG: RcpC/CpaB family pilus assembly protein [Planctomycetota bacterium]
MQSKVAILVAIIVGVIAVVLIHLYLQRGEDETVLVLKAVKDLKEGTILKKAYFEEQEIPSKAYSKRHHVTPSVFRAMEGQKLIREYRKGDFLSIADAASVESLAIERPTPEEGRRYVPVQVSYASGAAGLMRKGDHVDLVVVQRLSPTVDPRGGQGRGEDLKITVLRNVIVRELVGERSRLFGDEGGYYSTFAVDLSTAQAIILAAVQNRATFVLLQRNRHEPAGKESIEMTMYSTSLVDAIDRMAELLAADTPASGDGFETLPVVP